MSQRDDPINIFSVANAAGVSPATVSRVMNHPQMVSVDTRKRVEEAIRETGYIRNRAAQAMHGRRSATIGLIVPTVDYAIFASLVQSFGAQADALGFTLLLAAHGYDLRREYDLLRKFLEHRVDGVAVIGLDHDEDSFALIASQKAPTIALWHHDPVGRLPSVGVHNGTAGRIAAQHLLDEGHCRIALLFPPVRDNDRARMRQSAVIHALAAVGITVPDAYCAVSQYDVGRAKAAATGVLQLSPRPTAILCGNDVIARGAIYAAAALGLAVPADVSIIGIGDFNGSGDMVPALTTVHLPATEIGTAGATQLVEMILSRNSQMAGQAFPVNLVRRCTTGPPYKAEE